MQSDRMPHPGTRRNRNDRPAGQQRVAIASSRPRPPGHQQAPRPSSSPHAPEDAPDATPPLPPPDPYPRCIIAAPDATTPTASSLHLTRPADDIAGHACQTARHRLGPAAGPHAAPQAARVHATCRMMHQTQFCSLRSSSANVWRSPCGWTRLSTPALSARRRSRLPDVLAGTAGRRRECRTAGRSAGRGPCGCRSTGPARPSPIGWKPRTVALSPLPWSTRQVWRFRSTSDGRSASASEIRSPLR